MACARSAASCCARILSWRSENNPTAASTATGSTISRPCQKKLGCCGWREALIWALSRPLLAEGNQPATSKCHGFVKYASLCRLVFSYFTAPVVAKGLDSCLGSPMNFLVTGGAGFIGSHVCERLLQTGHAVWAL